jgi:hypothetical protein
MLPGTGVVNVEGRLPAVVFDAESTSADGSGNKSWDHTPVGTPTAIYVIGGVNSNDDEGLTATYGGEPMIEHTMQEGISGALHFFTLEENIPTGEQEVVVNGAGGFNNKWAAFSVTSGASTVEDVDDSVDDSGLTNPSTTLQLGGFDCFCFLALASSHDGTGSISPLANWTSVFEVDHGSQVQAVYRYDTIADVDVTAGFTQSSESANMLAVAVR